MTATPETTSAPREHFADRLLAAIERRGTPCIAGIDPAIELMPEDFLAAHGHGPEASAGKCGEILFAYSRLVLDAVCGLVPMVKPQSAYYERYGAAGIEALERTIAAARERGLMVLLDVKRGDIGASSRAYAAAYISGNESGLSSDAMTLSPYLGGDSLAPFIEAANASGTGNFVCVKTSNPGSGDLQDREITTGGTVYEAVAALLTTSQAQVSGKSGYSNLGAVVGGTYPEAARRIRKTLSRHFLLVPGFGAQGSSYDGLKDYFNPDGAGALISSSRAIMYPHRYGGDSRVDEAAITAAARQFIEDVNRALD